MPSDSPVFRYHFALVSKIPESFAELHRPVGVNLMQARLQHEEYIETLRRLGIDVLELPADEKHPDGVFVADTAVVINGTALITKPAATQLRLGETSMVRQILRNELGMKIVEVDNAAAQLEGRDVLFTGKEIFVGIGNNTNMFGAQAVGKAFPEYAVTVVTLPKTVQHLQDVIGVAGPDILSNSRTAAGIEVLRGIMNRATFQYQVIRVDEDAAANVLFANGYLLHLSDRIIEKSFPIWQSKFDNRIVLDTSELVRAGGYLTSSVLLINKIKNYKSFLTTLEKGHHDLE